MKRLLGIAAPLCVCLMASHVHAQDDDDRVVWQPLARVRITAPHGGTNLQVAPAGSNRAIAECTTYCDFWAPPGRYTLYVRDLETGERIDLPLRIKESASFAYQEEDSTLRGFGMALGLFGSVSTIIGLGVLFSNVNGDSPAGSPSTASQRTAVQVGGLMFLGGAVLTPIGFVMYGQNGAKVKTVASASGEASGQPRLQLGLVGVNGGLGLGGGAVF